MKKSITIYYCGNELSADDSAPFAIIPKLEKNFTEIDFIHHDPNENLPIKSDNALYDLIIIDTVAGIDKVISISDEKQIATNSVYSPHDWDLALNLKLLLKLKKIKNFLIIGIPANGKAGKTIMEVSRIIEKTLSFPASEAREGNPGKRSNHENKQSMILEQ